MPGHFSPFFSQKTDSTSVILVNNKPKDSESIILTTSDLLEAQEIGRWSMRNTLKTNDLHTAQKGRSNPGNLEKRLKG